MNWASRNETIVRYKMNITYFYFTDEKYLIAFYTDKDGSTTPRFVHQTNRAVIPCKPTHPDTEIDLYFKTSNGEQVRKIQIQSMFYSLYNNSYFEFVIVVVTP